MNNKIHLPFSIDSFPKKLLTLVPSIETCKLFKENNLFQTEETKTIFAWFKTHPVGNPEILNFVSLYGKIEYEYAYPAPTFQELFIELNRKIIDKKNEQIIISSDIDDLFAIRFETSLSSKDEIFIRKLEAASLLLLQITKSSTIIE